MFRLIFLCCIFLLKCQYAFGAFGFEIDDKTNHLTKHPLQFGGFGHCPGCKIRLTDSYVVIEVPTGKKIGTIASAKETSTLHLKSVKFLWAGDKNPLEEKDYGKIEGSYHKIENKGNTMEAQFVFYDPKIGNDFHESSQINGVTVVVITLQTDERVMDNRKFNRISKAVKDLHNVGDFAFLTSAVVTRKHKDGKRPVTKKVAPVFSWMLRVSKTNNKVVYYYEVPGGYAVGSNNKYKAKFYILEPSIPISQKQVHAFYSRLKDKEFPHIAEEPEGKDDIVVQVLVGPDNQNNKNSPDREGEYE